MANAWEQFKRDMKENNAKAATRHKENVKQSKVQLREINAEAREKRGSIEGPKAKVSGTRKLWALWIAIFTAPLLLFAVVLFIVAIMFFWDAIVGL